MGKKVVKAFESSAYQLLEGGGGGGAVEKRGVVGRKRARASKQLD